MMKHTPTPWFRNISARYPIYAGDEEKRDWKHIASMVHNHTTTEDEREANLRFIVRACNSHYDLLRLLKAAKDYVVEVSSSDEDGQLLDEIDAAISQAEAVE